MHLIVLKYLIISGILRISNSNTTGNSLCEKVDDLTSKISFQNAKNSCVLMENAYRRISNVTAPMIVCTAKMKSTAVRFFVFILNIQKGEMLFFYAENVYWATKVEAGC